MGKIYKGLLIVFITFWIVFIFLDYWQHHPVYTLVTKNFAYLDLVLVTGILSAGLGWLVINQRKKKKVIPWLNGLSIFGTCLFVAVMAICVFYPKAFKQGPALGTGIFVLAGKYILTGLFTYFIILVCHTLGSLINRKFFRVYIPHIGTFLVNIVLGIMSVTFISFFVGAVGLLRWFVMFPVFAIILFIGRNTALEFLKTTLISPIKVDANLNWVGVFAFAFLMVLVSLNFLQIITPMPTGWDALTLYVNLPSLIDDYNGLVKGYQPYNWSLFMALGYTLFSSTPVVLAISMLGGLLTVLTIYNLGRNWMKQGINTVLMAMLIFYMMPTVGHQSYLELKVDLGLLFVLMSILVVFVAWAKEEQAAEKINLSAYVADKLKGNTSGTRNEGEEVVVEALEKEAAVVKEEVVVKKKKKKVKTASLKTKNNSTIQTKKVLKKSPPLPSKADLPYNPFLILLGLLTGFGLGIKLTTLFTLFGVIAGMWYIYFGRIAFLGISFLSIFGVLLVRLDEMSGLRQYHLSVNWQMWICAIVGLGLLGFAIRKELPRFFEKTKSTLIYILFAVLPFLPWLTKNYVESSKVSMQTILNGETHAPDTNMRLFEENYQKFKQQGN